MAQIGGSIIEAPPCSFRICRHSPFSKHFIFVDLEIPLKQKLILENASWRFIDFSKQFGVFKSINKGSTGLKNPEIMEMLGFGLPQKQIEKL